VVGDPINQCCKQDQILKTRPRPKKQDETKTAAYKTKTKIKMKKKTQSRYTARWLYSKLGGPTNKQTHRQTGAITIHCAA